VYVPVHGGQATMQRILRMPRRDKKPRARVLTFRPKSLPGIDLRHLRTADCRAELCPRALTATARMVHCSRSCGPPRGCVVLPSAPESAFSGPPRHASPP